ncbi:MAG: hypothetical protein QW220_03030 [Candidatus Bathyarchaeia archaeon]
MVESITITVRRDMEAKVRRNSYNLAPLYVRCHGCGHRRASHNIRYCPHCGRILCYKCFVPTMHGKDICSSRHVKHLESDSKKSLITDGR